jgi:Holliday junction resolvase-like predicted endonuclease
MPNSNYRDGRDLEYAVMKHLKDNGYIILARASGSHGPADVIALKPRGELLLVQCKTGGKESAAKRANLAELAGWADAVPLIASWQPSGPRGGRRPGYNLCAAGHPSWTPDHALEATP